MMSKIFVSGLANVETSCAVKEFPIEYQAVDYNFFGINSIASGVGLNVSLALTSLSDEVTFATFVGDDIAAESVLSACKPISDLRIARCEQTPQSVVLYDKSGKRRVYTDLKNVQEIRLPDQLYTDLNAFDAFCICNINFSRELLSAAKKTGKPILCDVHCLSDIYDKYNADFMKAADVLFLSNENIIGKEEELVRELTAVYPCKIVVVGEGSDGSLLYERELDRFTMIPSVYTRPVINTVGAGDALFSAFTHFYIQGATAEDSLRYATVFASYKIGESGASKGFLSEQKLQELVSESSS